ncbi:TRAP transporter fused permease subunit [Halomonas sp. McH1-25]|uniref:TRAP transporter permease n=1 Tax=unclassified Halomonas TaxID=2609666 RepID=UPI001EF7447A|nr:MULTISPECIES: TRAP transporter fused permease subunit [unclassified Halomonas]MCG7601519.1 TRAP transporter fused permease subunit [Halomonas sp. McH1-25]MCP1343930.1 TRAP transporter fused permease subunit [Halomonas sp. FL8]MCP1361535.1 TRAP transporter fused permease subunit [Halomonas sp. BBD45]
MSPQPTALPDPALRGLGLAACAALTLFIVWTTLGVRYPAQIMYGIALLLGLIATFSLKPGLLAPRFPKLDQGLSVLLILLSLASSGYYLIEYDNIAAFREGLPNTWDILCYATGTLLVLEAARRVEGWTLVAIAGGALLYLFFGHYLPGELGHRKLWFDQVLEVSYSYQGIYGIALGAVVDVVLMFVILGAALRHTGAGDFFNFLALRLANGRRSGAAQAAIIGSAMFGSVNGSAPANVMSTGVLTIPMMKRAGYQGRFAGAVEAVASCSGQLMPPIMGVGAFIMAEISGIAYPMIALAAIVPAFLYLLALSAAVAFEAGRLQLKPEETGNDPFDHRRKSQGIVLLGGFATLITLLMMGYSPTWCGMSAATVVLAIAMLLPDTRLSLNGLKDVIVDGGRDGLAVLISCAAIGIVIGAVNVTGLGVTLNQAIVGLGEGHLLLALVLAALCSILLGMGLPTAASYLMVIFVAGPAILDLGVDKLQTHLFVFYYAVLSAITPPVALAVFAAAAITGERTLSIAFSALRLSLVAFLLPFAWVYHPEINLEPQYLENLPSLIATIAMMILATIGISAANVGFFRRKLNPVERLAMVLAGIIALTQGLLLSVIASVVTAALMWHAYRSHGPSSTHREVSP